MIVQSAVYTQISHVHILFAVHSQSLWFVWNYACNWIKHSSTWLKVKCISSIAFVAIVIVGDDGGGSAVAVFLVNYTRKCFNEYLCVYLSINIEIKLFCILEFGLWVYISLARWSGVPHLCACHFFIFDVNIWMRVLKNVQNVLRIFEQKIKNIQRTINWVYITLSERGKK